MSVIDEKLKRFENIIFSDVDLKIKAANAEIDSYKQTTLTAHQEQLIDEYFGYMQEQVKQIKSEMSQQVSKEELSAQRELLSYRNKLADQVFDAVRQHLADYTAGAEYGPYLVEKIKAALGNGPEGEYDLLVREADLPLLQNAAFPSTLHTAADNSIQLGGFILLSQAQGVMIDESFDSKLGELVSEFNQKSGLTIAR